MSTVEVTRLYNYTMKSVLPGFGLVSRLVKEFCKVDFEWELEAIIALRGRVRITL